MGTSNYSDEFKRDAVHQITVRGYPVREVSRRLGISTHSLCKWMKLFGECHTVLTGYCPRRNQRGSFKVSGVSCADLPAVRCIRKRLLLAHEASGGEGRTPGFRRSSDTLPHKKRKLTFTRNEIKTLWIGRQADIHTQYLLSGERTCIDCRKAIAHELPDMTGIEPGWTEPEELQAEEQPGLDDGKEIRSFLTDTASG